jgi:hypothetical protein
MGRRGGAVIQTGKPVLKQHDRITLNLSKVSGLWCMGTLSISHSVTASPVLCAVCVPPAGRCCMMQGVTPLAWTCQHTRQLCWSSPHRCGYGRHGLLAGHSMACVLSPLCCAAHSSSWCSYGADTRSCLICPEGLLRFYHLTHFLAHHSPHTLSLSTPNSSPTGRWRAPHRGP